MDQISLNDSLFSFIRKSPTAFHATAHMRETLVAQGFSELSEGTRWDLKPGKRYVFTRNGALVAFSLGNSCDVNDGFRIIGAHTDSPSLQLKPHFRATGTPYLVSGVEKYGGGILHTWFDRELSIAGRASCLLGDGQTVSLLVDFREPVAYIPSLAIHFDREINNNFSINVQTDLSPILSQDNSADYDSLLVEHLNSQYPELHINSIYGVDLFCYDPAEPRYFGFNKEFISAPRLDNLLSCFLGLESILQAGDHTNCMLVCTNHEEVGSTSNSGALGNLPDTIFSRITNSGNEKAICLYNSFLISLDNAHASHPNFHDKGDADHPILLNHGPVIKINANLRYCSSAPTVALFRLLAEEAGIKTQDFVMRSDMPCGSTIGPLASAQLGVNGIDVGLPTWGMHSIREVTGNNDPWLLHQVVSHYLNRKSLPSFRE